MNQSYNASTERLNETMKLNEMENTVPTLDLSEALDAAFRADCIASGLLPDDFVLVDSGNDEGDSCGLIFDEELDFSDLLAA